MFRLAVVAALLAAPLGCTQSDVYAQTGLDPIRPDRLNLGGTLCTEDTTGSRFPVKVLFVVDNSIDMFTADPNGNRLSGPPNSIDGIINAHRFQPHVRFGFLGFSTAARAFPQQMGQRFFRPQDPEVQQALAGLQTPLGSQRDVVSALAAAESFILADIEQANAGEVLRTRYLVSMLLAGPSRPIATSQDLSDQTARLVTTVYERGALEVRVNLNYLYYGPQTTTGFGCYSADSAQPACACGGQNGNLEFCRAYCDSQSGLYTDARADEARLAYRAMSFAGGGLFREIPCASQLDLSVGIATGGVQLVRKDIVAYNRNVRLGAEGPVLDSDGDGLSDAEELALTLPTDPTRADSDNDGLGDRIELRTFPEQDPLDPFDRPNSCLDPAIVGTLPDRDLDLLNDCEEGIIQTSPTIPDTDGDGLPDSLELFAGTVPTSADDRMLDFDGDGADNAREVAEHTDPRSDDGSLRGIEGYRTRISSLGLTPIATLQDSDELLGITFRDASPNVAPGQAYLRWDSCAGTLEWSDARYPAYRPIPTAVPTSGIYTLTAEFHDPQTDQLLDTITIELEVTRDFMPDCATAAEVVARPLLTVSERSCYDVRISNIKLMQTLPVEGDPAPGVNHVLVFFTQAPIDRLSAAGITKVAEIRVQYYCDDPEDLSTCGREPADGFFLLRDSDFVSALP